MKILSSGRRAGNEALAVQPAGQTQAVPADHRRHVIPIKTAIETHAALRMRRLRTCLHFDQT
jgi:hypothetical protein